jgi:hypothetical protein
MVKFGWRLPDFPVDGSAPEVFRDQQFAFLEEFQGCFDSAWAADHFVPWMASWDPFILRQHCDGAVVPPAGAAG